MPALRVEEDRDCARRIETMADSSVMEILDDEIRRQLEAYQASQEPMISLVQESFGDKGIMKDLNGVGGDSHVNHDTREKRLEDRAAIGTME